MTDAPRGSFFQRLFARNLPDVAMDKLERESRAWKVTCRRCGQSRDLWDRGGIRAGALGTKYTFGRCPDCGRLSWQRIHRD